MKRKTVKIDENLCIGCGACVKGCHGGALQLIDGKARIIDADYCDGLGACIGECQAGAITLEECGTVHTGVSATTSISVTSDEQNAEHACCIDSTQLNQFPIQLRLVNPGAGFLKYSDLILAADCTAYVYSHFHHRFMKNNSLVIACPKLDHAANLYVEKLTKMIDGSSINILTVILMEVPCCGGLLQIARQALANARRKIPVKKVVIGINGNLLTEEWI